MKAMNLSAPWPVLLLQPSRAPPVCNCVNNCLRLSVLPCASKLCPKPHQPQQPGPTQRLAFFPPLLLPAPLPFAPLACAPSASFCCCCCWCGLGLVRAFLASGASGAGQMGSGVRFTTLVTVGKPAATQLTSFSLCAHTSNSRPKVSPQSVQHGIQVPSKLVCPLRTPARAAATRTCSLTALSDSRCATPTADSQLNRAVPLTLMLS